MTLKYVLISGFAAAALLSTTASAQDDDTYVCNDQLCYDDQAEETRQLNLQQLENPGGDMNSAADGYDDADTEEMQGQGGPFFESEDEANQSGAMSDDDMIDDDPDIDDDTMDADDDDMAPPADDLDDDY
jgi:hypothetical protein